MHLTLPDLENQLSKNQLSPLYFIMGSERFLIKEILHKIKSHILSPELMEFNYEVFFASKMELYRLQESSQTLPVLSQKRVIICEEAHFLAKSYGSTFLSLLKKPVDSSILIFISETPDKRLKVIKDLMSFCTVISAEVLNDSQWVFWFNRITKKAGLSFSDSAFSLIKEYVGNDLLNLETEIKKIKNFVGSKTHVLEKDILAVVPRIKYENVFALSKAIGQKNLSGALLCLARLLEDNHNEIGSLALISRHIRILARIKEGVKKGHTEQTLCKKIGVPRFVIRNYIQEVDLWTEKKILSSIEILKATDKALKSSPVSAHIWLENFIIKTCLA